MRACGTPKPTPDDSGPNHHCRYRDNRPGAFVSSLRRHHEALPRGASVPRPAISQHREVPCRATAGCQYSAIRDSPEGLPAPASSWHRRVPAHRSARPADWHGQVQPMVCAPTASRSGPTPQWTRKTGRVQLDRPAQHQPGFAASHSSREQLPTSVALSTRRHSSQPTVSA